MQRNLILYILAILVPIIAISLGLIFLPKIFWDEFIWKYYVSGLIRDEGYNVVDTITYGIILALSVYGIYNLLKMLNIEINLKFFICILPFILLGSSTRALEDAELFKVPLKYLFISPIIYILIGITVIIILILGSFIENKAKKNKKNGLVLFAISYFSLFGIYLGFFFLLNREFSYLPNPIIVFAISLIIFIGIILYKYGFNFFKKKNEQKKEKLEDKTFDKRKLISNFLSKTEYISVKTVLFSFGLFFIVLSFYFIFLWQIQSSEITSWIDFYENTISEKNGLPIENVQINLKPNVFLLILGLTILSTLIVFAIFKFLSKKKPFFLPFLFGINLILFFAHFLDASATFVGIDFYNYTEKHVLPSFLIGIVNSAGIMYVLKFLVVFLVVYLIDIEYKNDLEKDKLLTGLVKLCIFILGLAPGIRDMLRLGMGV